MKLDLINFGIDITFGNISTGLKSVKIQIEYRYSWGSFVSCWFRFDQIRLEMKIQLEFIKSE